ncbi:SH3 domain-containing protein [Rhizophagus clarus]|uniref:SH3 domain-containing protein n=1 Tax=Rhizophagus clarus TaxID=94130 RepID=A0A8H3QL80_9GLOM|nr:SH3 domain-containing protein [Rhizophagus clarus]
MSTDNYSPDSNSPVVGRVSGSVDVVCQTTGSAAIADMSPGSSYNIWDQLQDGNYINDLYVHTGACGFNGLPRC